jgi:hypothetical protein
MVAGAKEFATGGRLRLGMVDGGPGARRRSSSHHLARTWAIALAGVALSLLTTTALGVSAFSLQATQAASIPVDTKQFLGTWTAEHEGTPFIVLDLRSEKGKLAGGMRMAGSFHMDNEGSAVNIEITG